MADRGYAQLPLGETRLYASAVTPSGIFNAIIAAAEYHGTSREHLEKLVDLDKMEQQFAEIDALAFRKLLNAVPFNAMQVTIVGALDAIEPRSTVPTRDPGSQLGRVA